MSIQTLTCTTQTAPISQILCRAQTLSPFALSLLPAYTSLPLCVQSIVSYELLSQPICIVNAVGGPAISTTMPYAECFCSRDFAGAVSIMGDAVEQECGGIVASSAWTGIPESYCEREAGGFVDASTTGTRYGTVVGRSTSGGEASKTVQTSSITITLRRSTAMSSGPSITASMISSTAIGGHGSGVGEQAKEHLAGGVIAGVAVAAVAGLFLFVFLFFILCFRRRKTQSKTDREGGEEKSLGSSTDKSEKEDGKQGWITQDYDMHRFFNRFNMRIPGSRNRGR